MRLIEEGFLDEASVAEISERLASGHATCYGCFSVIPARAQAILLRRGAWRRRSG
jgi:hypothetical protein